MIQTSGKQKFFEIFWMRPRRSSDERASNLVVVTSEDTKTNEGIAKIDKEKFFEIFRWGLRRPSEERASNLVVVTSDDAPGNADNRGIDKEEFIENTERKQQRGKN